MLKVNMDDVQKLLGSIKPQLIVICLAILCAIVIAVAVSKQQKAKRAFFRKQGFLAAFIAVIIAVNSICFGPMSTLITLATGNGVIKEETSKEATVFSEKITDEGIVLLKNDEGFLPLSVDNKLNVFGWGAQNPCYGGTGSGALSDAYETVDLLTGLKNSGYELNQELIDFYNNFRVGRPEVGMWAQDWSLPEPTVDKYTDDLINNAKTFSDKAVIVITRVGGEGADLPTDVSKVTYTDNSAEYKDFEDGEHYLQLSQTEKNMVDLVCKNFDNVALVFNGANAFELGFINELPQIKSVLWVAGTGQSGFNSLGKIMSGSVNPSGKTADTFVYDLFDTPTTNNFGSFAYDNVDEFEQVMMGFTGKENHIKPTFVNYVEGIYVGYKFYETAAYEGLINYDEKVQFPFGYGLSYTDFEQKMGEIKDDGTNISFDVEVTNTGLVPGKSVVQVYYNPPYTNGGIEKSTANLVQFAKTKELAKGESEIINITFAKEDMASYDYQDAKAYVLEAGDYKISIRHDSHNIIDEKILSISDNIIYNQDNKRPSDEVTATNLFDQANASLNYLSRKDNFANYAEATKAPESFSLPDEYKALFINNGNYNVEDYNNADDVAPTVGANNAMKLSELRGAAYDDEKWDKLLDQLTVSDMDKMIAYGGYQTHAAPSVGKVQTVDCDGPASINNNFTKVGSIGFASAVVIANTFNTELAEEFGSFIGRMADEMNVSGWYAPAMNIHRTAFAGRNFEYYSEDGVLSGYIAAAATKGSYSHGVYAYMKHFAMNDQETNRCDMLCTWSNEQAIREIYLKPFEICVKKGEIHAVMSAFNYIGIIYAGAYPALLNDVLRGEWGFKGFVLTDYFGVYGYQNADQEIRSGNDVMLVAYDTATNHVKDQTSATSLKAMRQACKNIMYTVVNSRAYDESNLKTGVPAWHTAAIVINVVLFAGIAFLEYMAIKKYKSDKEESISYEA